MDFVEGRVNAATFKYGQFCERNICNMTLRETLSNWLQKCYGKNILIPYVEHVKVLPKQISSGSVKERLRKKKFYPVLPLFFDHRVCMSF